MKKRIIISVSSDLATDQRVQKVANTCHNNGYEVVLIGRKMKNSLPVSFSYKHKRFKLLFTKSALFYAEYNIRLFLYLLFAKTNILLSNDTDTLLANYLVSKIRKMKLIFDAHELFPEVPELSNRPFVKQFWTKIEDRIFPKLKYSYTVCQSIADYYKNKYNLDMKVIRNVPYYQKNQSKRENKEQKTIIYQGALNVGRGLEWIIPAMKYIDDTQLVIVGDGDIKKDLMKLTNKLSLNGKIQFLDKVLPNELKNLSLQADIGLCLLENRGLSYYYSLPNRIFDYIQAGIPVIATDFPEIRKIVETYKTGILIDQYDKRYLAKVINEMLNNNFETGHFDDLSKIFCWENEEKVLLKILNEIN